MSGGNCSSPMSRLGQRLVTLISSLFLPGRPALERSTRNGGFHRMPSAFPFTKTSARFFTLPRSSHSERSLRASSAGFPSPCVGGRAGEILHAVSPVSVHEVSRSNSACGGATSRGGNVTIHEPVTSCGAATASTREQPLSAGGGELVAARHPRTVQSGHRVSRPVRGSPERPRLRKSPGNSRRWLSGMMAIFQHHYKGIPPAVPLASRAQASGPRVPC